MPRHIHVSPDASDLRFVVLCARFNEEVTRALLDGALSALRDHHAPDESIEVAWVPGSFELPLAAKVAAKRQDVSAVICLGAVIRGQTPHFDFVSYAASTGIVQAGLECGKPITFGVLTTDTPEQAFERAGGKLGNKGADAALAAIEMACLVLRLGENASSL
ncbi:6,7-dimethyl-8-ribityllumazine synthase [bacterium]|nr:6,7-dimethyl-8-ribityllumazine synthase [bacterium]MBU1983792.1 6,7-dimethyl-8-ribityllumazine synthase [bacterium]